MTHVGLLVREVVRTGQTSAAGADNDDVGDDALVHRVEVSA